MARDLIPPPSPAGRPDPDGPHPGDVAIADPPPELPAGPAEPAEPAEPAGPAPFRGRFGFALGALIGVVACAGLALVVILLAGPAGDRGRLAAHWSRWQPPTSDPAVGAADIADQVGADYRLDNGKQLVGVDGGALQVQGTPVSIALQPDDGSIRDLGSDGVLFTLHGLGRGGQIVGEPASTARHALLRREALELALYSFRYLDGIREVVTLLPPTNPKAAAKAEKGAAARATAKEKSQQQAVLFQPGDLVRYLHAPLARTIAPGRLSPQALTAGQTQAIDRLTLPNLFLASLQIAQNQKLYMVLARPGASSASSASSSSSSSSGG